MFRLTTLGVRSLLVAIAFLCASPGAAQQLPEPWADPLDQPGRVDISVTGGVGAPTDWSDLVVLGTISPAFGVFEQVLVRDLRVKRDTEIGAAVTYWRGRYGFRAQAALSRSTLVVGQGPVDASRSPFATESSLSVDLDTWSYDVRGVIGLIEYSRGAWVWPYAWFGVGGMTYQLDRAVRPPLLAFIESGRSRAVTPDELVIIEGRSREFLLSVNEVSTDSVLAFNAGIGTDVRLPLGPAGVGLRLELSDHIAPSPVSLQIGELRRANVLTTDTGVAVRVVHHLRATAGFVIYVGR
jgi:hypothetical protein